MPFPVKREENQTEVVYYISSGKFMMMFFAIGALFFVSMILGNALMTKIFLGLFLAMVIYIVIVYIPIQRHTLKANWAKKKITNQRLSWMMSKITIEK